MTTITLREAAQAALEHGCMARHRVDLCPVTVALAAALAQPTSLKRVVVPIRTKSKFEVSPVAQRDYQVLGGTRPSGASAAARSALASARKVRNPCNHEGIGQPGCETCAPRTPTPDPLRNALDYALARDAGGGYVRSTESLAVDVLRGLEVQGFTIAPIAAAQPAPALDVERLQRIEAAARGEFIATHHPECPFLRWTPESMTFRICLCGLSVFVNALAEPQS